MTFVIPWNLDTFGNSSSIQLSRSVSSVTNFNIIIPKLFNQRNKGLSPFVYFFETITSNEKFKHKISVQVQKITTHIHASAKDKLTCKINTISHQEKNNVSVEVWSKWNSNQKRSMWKHFKIQKLTENTIRKLRKTCHISI